jgi:hypothetical protein
MGRFPAGADPDIRGATLRTGSFIESAEAHVYVETNTDTPLTREQARELAAVLLECADELDRWAGA